MKVLNLFPLSIIQDKILIDAEIKKQMLEEILSMEIASKNKDLKDLKIAGLETLRDLSTYIKTNILSYYLKKLKLN